jgi:hypothetical protein
VKQRQFITPSVTLTDVTVIICLAVIIAGILFRLSQYFANRALWVDEAALALNIVNRSFVELAQPLDRNQGAPLGFLFVEKVLTVLLGNTDYVLRLFPIICGLVSLLVMYALARRLFVERVSIVAAVVLFAVSDRLIYYASEVKQYSSDALICLLALLVCERFVNRNPSNWDFALLATFGATAILFSHSAVFVLAGVGTALSLEFILKRDWHSRLKLGVVFCFWLVPFVALYFVSYRQLSENENLLAFWQQGFMPFPPWRNWGWFISRSDSVMADPLGLPNKSAILLLVAGITSIWLRRWEIGAVLLFPIAFTLIASALHMYPFSGRLVLFLVPIFSLFLAETIGRIRSFLDQFRPSVRIGLPVAIAVLLWVVIIPSRAAVLHVWQPRLREEIKPILNYLSVHRRVGELIYVYYGAEGPVLFYSTLFGITANNVIYGSKNRGNFPKYINELDKLRGMGRVWFVFSHNYNRGGVDEQAEFLAYLDKIGKRLDQLSAENSSLYLYDL